MKYYRHKCSLFPIIVERVSQRFKNDLVDVILYGSNARNQQTIESDTDIFVFVNKKPKALDTYEDEITDISVVLSLEYAWC